jgi:hypothetical protein
MAVYFIVNCCASSFIQRCLCCCEIDLCFANYLIINAITLFLAIIIEKASYVVYNSKYINTDMVNKTVITGKHGWGIVDES